MIKNRDSPSFNEDSSHPKSKNATLLIFNFHDWIGKTKKTLLQPKPTAPIFCFLLPILSDLTNNHRRDVAATRSGDNSSMSSIPIVAIAEHSYLNCCAVGHYMVWQHANFKQSVSLRQSVEMSWRRLKLCWLFPTVLCSVRMIWSDLPQYGYLAEAWSEWR